MVTVAVIIPLQQAEASESLALDAQAPNQGLTLQKHAASQDKLPLFFFFLLELMWRRFVRVSECRGVVVSLLLTAVTPSALSQEIAPAFRDANKPPAKAETTT